jgi:CheY-like chemotaxis protein
MKVLVVEDDDLVRMVAVDCLQDAGFEVIEAATGEDAVERCREGAADVLFTDIVLPGHVSGWDIAELCRQHDPDLPVVYATGFSPQPARLVPGARLSPFLLTIPSMSACGTCANSPFSLVGPPSAKGIEEAPPSRVGAQSRWPSLGISLSTRSIGLSALVPS